MEISNTTTAAKLSTASAASPSQADAVLSSDFETFLKMLTAQARFQDPLEPIDSSEYAAQLAQFSMVEQQVLSNDLLKALGNQIGSGTMAQMAGWIGMEARTSAPVQYDGAPLTIVPQIEPGADEAILIAYNAQGDEVQRRQISASGEAVEWAGVDQDNTPFDAGLYSFKVESRSLGQTIGINGAESYARVVEARREGAETLLILNGGASISAEEVTALREAV
jgi:flagellar basal-body rod modification protein FlgD